MQRGVATIWWLVLLAALALGVVVAWPYLRGTPAAPSDPKPTDVVLQIGPFDFTDAELNEVVDWVRSIDPAKSPSSIRSIYLDDLLLPKRIVETDLADEVAKKRQLARQLATAVESLGGGLQALRDAGAQFGIAEDDTYRPPFTMALDIAQQVFTTDVGSVVGPIHSAFGSVVIGILDQQIANGIPKRRLLRVFFPYGKLRRPDIARRVRALKAGKAWAHPYYRSELGLRHLTNLQPEPIRPL